MIIETTIELNEKEAVNIQYSYEYSSGGDGWNEPQWFEEETEFIGVIDYIFDGDFCTVEMKCSDLAPERLKRLDEMTSKKFYDDLLRYEDEGREEMIYRDENYHENY